MSRSGFQIHVIVTGPGTNYNLQLLGCIEHFRIDDITTDNDGIGIFHSFQQFGFLAIFFQQSQFVTCCFYLITDAVYGHFGKRLIGCYQYFHNYSVFKWLKKEFTTEHTIITVIIP